MNRRSFLKSAVIIAAPAFVSSSGLFRGATEIWVPGEVKWSQKDADVIRDMEEFLKILKLCRTPTPV